MGGAGEGGRGPGAPPAGSGAKGQAEGSARGAGAAARVTAAWPSHPQLGRRGRGGLGPSPAVCISLAGGGAWVERNRLHLERCLFFLTSQRRQTTSRARRPDSAEPSLGKGSGQGAARRGRAASPRRENAPGYPSGRGGGRVAVGRRMTFLYVGKQTFFCCGYLSFDLERGRAAKRLSFPASASGRLGFQFRFLQF